MNDRTEGGASVWRIVGWGGATLLLLLPAAAMQFTSEVVWTGSDFLIFGMMLSLAGLAMECALRASPDNRYRFAALAAVGGAFLLVWVNLAVGFLGDEDNPANLMFAAVLAVGLVGAILARLEPLAMAKAMFGTAAAQLIAGLVALFGRLGSPGFQGIYEAVMGTTLFSAIWLTSAFLFRKSADRLAQPE